MQQFKLCEYCQANEITVTAYAPIGSPGRKSFNPNGYWPEGNPLEDPVIISIAQRHDKTPAQVDCICLFFEKEVVLGPCLTL